MTMMGSIRSVRVTLTSLVLCAGSSWFSLPPGEAASEPSKVARARDDARKDDAAVKANERPPETPANTPGFLAQPGDDPPRPFVPLRPSTVDDRRRTEAVRLYSAARALEDQRAWSDAVILLQEAAKLDPDSLAVARRLCRIYVGALGRPELALQYGKRVLSIDPGDTNTLTRLVDYYTKNDPIAAEELLKEVLANPKLDAHAPGRLLAEFELGKLYSGRLRQIDKAADAYAKVLAALDDKSANRLSPADLGRVLGDDPSVAYQEFGAIFIAARRYDLAVKALERGMVYDDENSAISLALADTLLKLSKGEQALALVERHIERQTPLVETYELLAKVLKSLKREKEITPRLEAAARRDSKNVPLQYLLADRYRETGQIDKAEALYKELLTSQPTPQIYRALAASLLKRKKAVDLLKVISDAWSRTESQDAVKMQLLAAAADDALAEAMLDDGVKQSVANPPTLTKAAYDVLTIIAVNPGRTSADKDRRLETLLRIQRLRLEQSPSALAYTEIADTLRRMGNYAEAASTVEQLIAKYPTTKSVRTLAFLADYHRRANHLEAAKLTLREAMKLDPGDGESLILLVDVLRQIGQLDDAVRVLRSAIKKEPNNPLFELNLADLLSKTDHNDEAITLLEEMLKRHADNDQVVSLVRQNLSVIYVNRGDYGKGEAQLELLLARNPEDPGPNNDLGYLYAEQGKNLEKAESMIRKALQEEPESFAYLDSLGWVLFKRGKLKEALEPLKKAAEQMKSLVTQRGTSPDATIFEHLGDVYFQLQQLDQASDAWRQAAKAAAQAFPPDKRLTEVLKKIESLEKLGPSPKRAADRTP
jgi:tetratricopeptide (TPR) repeat protein